jgi:hypothetical protein
MILDEAGYGTTLVGYGKKQHLGNQLKVSHVRKRLIVSRIGNTLID